MQNIFEATSKDAQSEYWLASLGAKIKPEENDAFSLLGWSATFKKTKQNKTTAFCVWVLSLHMLI